MEGKVEYDLYNHPGHISSFGQILKELHVEKNLSMQELLNSLGRLTVAEEIYREYHRIREDKERALSYIKSLDPGILQENGMQFPELGMVYPNVAFSEKIYFTEEHLFDIILMKHPCYSPVIPHRHNFFEALYVLQGSFEHRVEGSSFKMEEGDFCILSPNAEHSLFVFDEKTIVINLLIRKSTFEQIFFNLLHGNNILSYFFLDNIYRKQVSNYILFHTKGDAQIQTMILEMLLEFTNKQAYFSDALNSRMATFFTILLRRYEKSCKLPDSSNTRDRHTYEMIRYLQEHYKEVTLDEVAAHFHFSSVYTSRLIRSMTGMTFTEFILRIRMDRCCNLLLTTAMPVASISELVGYRSIEHFMRTFRREMGMTPGEYRKTGGRGKEEKDEPTGYA